MLIWDLRDPFFFFFFWCFFGMLCSGMATLECNFFIPISFITVRQFQSESTGSLVSFIRFFQVFHFIFAGDIIPICKLATRIWIFSAPTAILNGRPSLWNFQLKSETLNRYFLCYFFCPKNIKYDPPPRKRPGGEEGEWVHSIKRKIRNGPPFDALLKFA